MKNAFFKKVVVIPSEAWEVIKTQTNVIGILARHGIVFKVDDYEASKAVVPSVPPLLVGDETSFEHPVRRKEVILPQSAIDQLKNLTLPNGASVLQWLNFKAGISLPAVVNPIAIQITEDFTGPLDIAPLGETTATKWASYHTVDYSFPFSIVNGVLRGLADATTFAGKPEGAFLQGAIISNAVFDCTTGFEYKVDILKSVGAALVEPVSIVSSVQVTSQVLNRPLAIIFGMNFYNRFNQVERQARVQVFDLSVSPSKSLFNSSPIVFQSSNIADGSVPHRVIVRYKTSIETIEISLQQLNPPGAETVVHSVSTNSVLTNGMTLKEAILANKFKFQVVLFTNFLNRPVALPLESQFDNVNMNAGFVG